jgi:hypothetical protein
VQIIVADGMGDALGLLLATPRLRGVLGAEGWEVREGLVGERVTLPDRSPIAGCHRMVTVSGFDRDSRGPTRGGWYTREAYAEPT